MKPDMQKAADTASTVPVLPGGVFAASLTPLTADLQPDTGLLVEHVQWLLANGCDGVVLFGTTGEANSLPASERMQALEVLLDAGVPRHRLMVGTGSCALVDTVELTRHAVRQGVGGVLVLPPWYYKNPADEGLFAFFDQVIQRVGEGALSVYLYHIPPVSQIPVSHVLVERLLRRYPGTIAGMKDSGGDFGYTQSMHRTFPQLHLLAGTERYLLDTLRLGAAGCVSASANVTCTMAARVLHAWRQESADVDTLQAQLTAARAALEPFPMIAALKFFHAARTGREQWRQVCPPLLALDEETGAKVVSAIQQHVF